jgi:arabinan endo-1,5-alpha-L-arabinosidase
MMRRIVVGVLAAVVAAGFALRAVPQGPSPMKADPRRVHDPSTIVKHKDEYWAFSTAPGVASLHSKDLVAWESGPPVFAQSPKWADEMVPGHSVDFWAPDVIRHDGRYLLYYSVSVFGKNTSVIALASNPTLDPADPKFKWTDHGVVIRTGPKDDYNAIDPCVVHGPDDTLWLAFGSFWSGIKLMQLDPKTGLRLSPDSPLYSLAHKEKIEAAALYRHGDYYYLFVNWGQCCQGTRSTYNIRVGRSRNITGPYLDRDGIDMLTGGGSLFLESEGRFIGPGHAGILKDGERYLLSYHFYDGDNRGRARLAIRPLEWDKDGWPRVAGKFITLPSGG